MMLVLCTVLVFYYDGNFILNRILAKHVIKFCL